MALKTLDYTSQAQSETQILESLQLVDFHLQNAKRPSVEAVRSWMLRKILVDYITTEVNKARYYFGLDAVSTNHNRQHENNALELVSRHDSPELVGWSILYLRYVRPELNFQVQELAKILTVDNRSIRRWQEIATRKLRDILADAEFEVRQSQQSNYLKSLIPHHIPHLIGRDDEQNILISYLAAEFSYPVQIYGDKGIGKSAFCAKVVQTLIEEQAVDYLIWIRQPLSIQVIKNKIWDTVSPYASEKHWRETLTYQKLLLIIDGIDNVALDSPEWVELTTDLQSASILLTSQKSQKTQTTHHLLPLKALNHQQSILLGQQFNSRNLSDVELIDGVNSSLGNPRYIIEMMQGTINGNMLNHLLDDMFNDLSQSELTILFLVIVSTTGLESRFLEDLTEISIEFSTLYQKNILTKHGELFYIADKYLEPLHNKFASDVNFQEISLNILHDLLEKIDNPHINNILLDCLSCEWYNWDKSSIQYVLESITLETISNSDVFRWRNLYLSHFGLENDVMPTLHYKHSIALRLLHHPDCEAYLVNLINFFGTQGQFKGQALVLYELALLYQLGAEFERAIGIYNQLIQSLSPYISIDLSEAINLQLVRIDIARQQGDVALDKLKNCDLENPDIFLLFCEAQFIQEEYDYIIDTALKYIHKNNLSNKVNVSLRTILARSYQEQAMFDKAIIQFNEALSIIEQEMSIAHIGRARSNLASAYLNSTDLQDKQTLHDVEQLLLETQNLQRRVNDPIGLEATTRNLSHLQSYQLKNS